jgi:hypothetical protein
MVLKINKNLFIIVIKIKTNKNLLIIIVIKVRINKKLLIIIVIKDKDLLLDQQEIVIK